jgi:hypothetical protein
VCCYQSGSKEAGREKHHPSLTKSGSFENIICLSCFIDWLVGCEECHMCSSDLLQNKSTIDIDTYWEFLVESILMFATE